MNTAKMRIAILISGRGSNMQALLADAAQADSPYQVCLVLSNRSEAMGLHYAQQAGVATEVILHQDFPDRESFDLAVQEKIDSYSVDLVVLAGFMRILSPQFVLHYHARLINIHPSLLPQFKGLHTHQRALEAGCTEHGASVHFVTEALDSGAVILQAKVPILADDNVDTLAARVLQQEHRIYPQAIRWFAQGRLDLRNNQAYLDGKTVNAGFQQ